MSLKTPFPSFTYHPHQEAGVRWMMEREEYGIYCNGGILADEMGLGKTWQTVGLLLNRPVSNTLLLVPPVLHEQWAEVLRQSSISYTTLTTNGFRLTSGKAGVHVVLATYDRAVRRIEDMNEKFTFSRIVCDEGHVFRNGPRTARFLKLSAIPAEKRWLLTGTPVQNRMADFKNLLRWLDADYDADLTPLESVAEEIMLRRTVADVREAVPAFPDAKPTHYIHPVVMPEDGEEKSIFDTLVRRFSVAVENRMESCLILELYLRIRQFLAHPQIYRDAMMAKYPPKPEDKTRRDPKWHGTASKMSYLRKFLSTTTKLPTLIFTTFRDEMEYAEEECKRAGYKTWRIAGGMGASGISAAVQKSKDAAAAGESVAVLVQIQAGNAGINLQHLHRIVFLSSHWNPAIVDQAVGRAYRIGQTKTVEVHHILLADGAEKNLDRLMARMHRKKRAVATHLCPKLACDSAVDTRIVFEELNAVCPDEYDAVDENIDDIESSDEENTEDPV